MVTLKHFIAFMFRQRLLCDILGISRYNFEPTSSKGKMSWRLSSILLFGSIILTLNHYVVGDCNWSGWGPDCDEGYFCSLYQSTSIPAEACPMYYNGYPGYYCTHCLPGYYCPMVSWWGFTYHVLRCGECYYTRMPEGKV